VPVGVFGNQTQLSITPRLVNTAKDPRGAVIRFDLDALDTTDGTKLTTFNQPLTITLNISGLIDLSQIPLNQHLFIAYQTADGQTVEAQPLHVNPSQGLIWAQVDHFSAWSAGVVAGTPGVWNFAYNAPQVSTYSGSATYNIPIDVPPGRHGLKPDLAITYSSARLNGRTEGDPVESGPIGDSWSINVMSIVRQRWQPCHWNSDGQGNYDYGSCFQDVFTLLMNGTGYDLDPSPGPLNGPYYAEGAPGVSIVRHNGCLIYSTEFGTCTMTNPAGGDSPLNIEGEYWTVTMPDGTQARLGYTADAEQIVDNVCMPLATRSCNESDNTQDFNHLSLGYKGHAANNTLAARSWRVDLITDTLGNAMVFTYTKLNTGGNDDRVTLRNIYYNNSGSSYLTHIALVGSDAGPEPTIAYIDVTNTNGSGAQVLVKKYVMTQITDTVHRPGCSDGGNQIWATYTTLSSFQEQDGSGVALPTQTFDYDWRSPTSCIDLEYLIKIDNGYGGVSTFTYGNPGGASNRDVASVQTTDGVGASTPMYATYAYGSACYDDYQSACASRATVQCGAACHGSNGSTQVLVGFDVVTQTQWNGAAIINQTVHYYYNADPYWQLGREYRTVTLDGSGQPLTENNTTYSTIPINGTTFAYVGESDDTTYSGGAALTKRTDYTDDSYGNQTAQYDYGAEERMINAGFEAGLAGWITNTVAATTTTAQPFAGQASLLLSGGLNGYVFQPITGLIPGTSYIYRAWVRAAAGTAQIQLYETDQSGSAWGTPTVPTSGWTLFTLPFTAASTGSANIAMYYVSNSGNAIYVDEVAVAKASDVGDERSTYNFYRNQPNGLWLVGLKYNTNVFAGITPNVANYSILKHQTFWYYDDYSYNPNNWGQTSQITRGLVTMIGNGILNLAGQPFVTTETAYDQWGNTTIVTDTRGNPTTTAYDGLYHLYPVQTTNAANQTARTDYDTAMGVPIAMTDANGLITTYTYDGFGRLTKIFKPGDGSDPWTRYDYSDTRTPSWVAPLLITEWHKPATTGTAIRHFYDGLGREIQTHSAYSVSVSGYSTPQDILVSRAFDARGLVVSQTAPYAAPAYVYNAAAPVNPYTTANMASAPKTLTAYDALGRPSVITAPDGTTTHHYYVLDVNTTQGYTPTYLWLHTITDANSHTKHFVQDAFGQLTRMREMSGTIYPYTQYAVTDYHYDVLGNLTNVTDTLGNTTVMTYDALGRKTDMLDPDMGHWIYQYDAAGNLITQTDALNHALWFNYDKLNRLIEKRQTNSGGSLLASYGYDQGANAIGRRVAMTDTSGSASWTYDTRGRVTNEAKTITGAGAFNTGYAYDGLDRVTGITYPSGEVVQQTYDPASRLLRTYL
jgi:YD repeat-containing protein